MRAGPPAHAGGHPRHRPPAGAWCCCRCRYRRRSSSGGSELRVRGVLELPEQAGDDEGGLLADVDCVIPDPLDVAAHEHHVHGPLAPVGLVSELERVVEDLPVEAVDLVILTNQILSHLDVAPLEGLTALGYLLAGLYAHALDEIEHA